MGTRLDEIYGKLLNIKLYLQKLGPERRKGEQASKRIAESKELYCVEFKECIALVNKEIAKSELKDPEIERVNDLVVAIKKVFKEISDYSVISVSIDNKMAAFDIKVAVSLLPVMDNTEDKTNQLIDAIELYASMIDDGSKVTLINFVLKTRLSKSAKLRLNSSYATVPQLLKDMRKHLLTQKSHTALLSKLSTCKQGNKSVAEFGKELEELFVDLTIAQAGGDDNAFDILKTINERNTIKKFADGLRDQKLSIVISARNFSSLKDAIRAAQDEDSTRNGNSQLMSMSRNNRGQYFSNRRYQERFNYNNMSTRQYSNSQRGRYNTYRGNNSNIFRGNNNRRSNRGRSNYNNNHRGRQNSNNSSRGNVNQINCTSSNTNVEHANDLNYFFRSDE